MGNTIYLLERLDFNRGWPDETPEGPEGKPIKPYLCSVTEMYRYNNDGSCNFVMRDIAYEDNPLVQGEINYLLEFKKSHGNLIFSTEKVFEIFGLERKRNVQGNIELYRALPKNSAEAKRLRAAGLEVSFA